MPRLLGRRAEIADEAAVDDRVADFGGVDHGRDLAWSEQRHGRHHHAAGLEHAKPGGEQGVAVRPAEQHAVAGDEAHLVDQQPGDAAAEIVEFAISPAAVRIGDGEISGLAAFQQLCRSIEAFRIVEQQKFRQLVCRRQTVTNETVVAHSGTTAVASISTIACGSTKRTTSTSAIAG